MGGLHTFTGQWAFIHLPAASIAFYYLPSFGDHRGKPGIELGKSGEQESFREAWEGAGGRAEKSAIMTFISNFPKKFRRYQIEIEAFECQ